MSLYGTPMIVRPNTASRKPDPYIDLLSIRSDQVMLASASFQEFKFHPDIKVKSVEDWIVSTFDGVDDFKRRVFVTSTDAAGVEGEVTRLTFHVQFEEGTKDLAAIYGQYLGEDEFFSYESTKTVEFAKVSADVIEVTVPTRRIHP